MYSAGLRRAVAQTLNDDIDFFLLFYIIIYKMKQQITENEEQITENEVKNAHMSVVTLMTISAKLFSIRLLSGDVLSFYIRKLTTPCEFW